MIAFSFALSFPIPLDVGSFVVLPFDNPEPSLILILFSLLRGGMSLPATFGLYLYANIEKNLGIT